MDFFSVYFQVLFDFCGEVTLLALQVRPGLLDNRFIPSADSTSWSFAGVTSVLCAVKAVKSLYFTLYPLVFEGLVGLDVMSIVRFILTKFTIKLFNFQVYIFYVIRQ